MHDTPNSLQQCCLDFICDNLPALCDKQQVGSPNQSQTKMSFKDPDVCLNALVSSQLLSTLCTKGKLNDASLSLFDPKLTYLEHVRIQNAPDAVTQRGLSILKGHNISLLEVTGMKGVTVNDILGCFGEWTLSNLQSLNVSSNTIQDRFQFRGIVSKLRNLHTLNVSFTDIGNQELETIVVLPCLKVLDISCTHISDISPLKKCKDQLTSLSMYNLDLELKQGADPIGVVRDLVHLLHLDVSVDNTRKKPIENTKRFPAAEYLDKYDSNPNLMSLDVSGAADVKENILEKFLENHNKLNFLGLLSTSMCEFEIFRPENEWMKSHPGFKVSGDFSVGQIMDSLHRYQSRKAFLLQAMDETEKLKEPGLAAVVKAALAAMEIYSNCPVSQTSAISCLYNAIRADDAERTQMSDLSKCVKLILTAMKKFPNDKNLLKKGLRTFNIERIRKHVDTACMERCQIALDSLVHYDWDLNNLSVLTAVTLLPKLPSAQRKEIGASLKYMRSLTSMLETRFVNHDFAQTMYWILCIFRSVTDDDPVTCRLLVREELVDLLTKMLNVMGDHDEAEGNADGIQSCIIGVLYNICEVEDCRSMLMTSDIVMRVKQRLRSNSKEVSIMRYTAAGILAYLCIYYDDEDWRSRVQFEREDALDDLNKAVMKWDDLKEQRLFAVMRSFRPLYDLLESPDTPVQLYAVWAMGHFISIDNTRYLTILNNEYGDTHLQGLMNSDRCGPKVRGMCQALLSKLEEHRKGPMPSCDGME